MKKLFSLLACGVIASSVCGLPVQATGGTESSAINIEAKDTTVNVTVPGTYAMVFNADGSDTLPETFTIQNNSTVAGVHISTVEVDAGSSGWSVLGESANLKTQAVNTKAIKLKVGEKGNEKIVAPTNGSNDVTGTATLGQSNFSIEASGSKTMNFVVERGAFSNAVASEKAFGMTLNFAFNS